MPAIQTPAKVLVTGANGYLGMWIIRTLLEHGFAVRAAVRSADKTAFITNTFKDHKDMVEFAIVEDITKDGAFNEAVKGVDAIHHVASPVVRETDDPQKILQPAIRGTVGILESALKFGPSVKRVILTSSVAAISQLSRGPATYSEKDWNDESEAEVERLGDKISTNSAYRASKTLAEKAAWKFCEDHKHEIGWDLVSINPPFLYGPGIHDVSTPDSLNSTANEWYRSLLEDGYPNSLTNKTAWVDVRDVAEAQVRALEREGAGGERILVSAGSYMWQDWLDTANSLKPSPLPNHTIPVGTPGSGKGAVYKNEYDTSKCLRILGMEYRTMEQTTRDTLAEYIASKYSSEQAHVTFKHETALSPSIRMRLLRTVQLENKVTWAHGPHVHAACANNVPPGYTRNSQKVRPTPRKFLVGDLCGSRMIPTISLLHQPNPIYGSKSLLTRPILYQTKSRLGRAMSFKKRFCRGQKIQR